ncbi:MAG TPA: UpxY family transcription antiterminator [Candidatus Angelobacter sp.]|nr:UpxY family transcription antiterminator [Candidatus Angelobacter sp.]
MAHSSFSLDSHCPHWFVLFVRANQEKRTAQRLASYEIEHFLPTHRSLRQWKDRRVTLEMPLFPGYVFVHLPFLERNRVLTLPNVVGLVGNKHSPSIVSIEEIDCIRKGISLGNAAPHPTFAIGQRVMIISGVLSGVQGTLLRGQNNTRVVISVDSIGRSFSVDVDISCLKPIESYQPLKRQVG